MEVSEPMRSPKEINSPLVLTSWQDRNVLAVTAVSANSDVVEDEAESQSQELEEEDDNRRADDDDDSNTGRCLWR